MEGLRRGARPSRQLFQLANHACYPAVAVRNGFGGRGALAPQGFERPDDLGGLCLKSGLGIRAKGGVELA